MVTMYFCTTFGDIELEQMPEYIDNKKVKLTTSNLTYGERKLVREILEEYDIETKEVAEIENASFIIENRTIEDVHKFMKKILKKNKSTITALKFKDGRIELNEEIVEEAEKGVTVEKPTRGCPMPVSIAGEIRASIVLKEFLSSQQNADFESHLQFISKGNYTGIPYLITSRWTKAVESWGQVYDIVNKKIICASAYEIPPSEEMLSLKLMLERKEQEFLR